MSPQLHNTLYGYFPHTWSQQYRWGFYRPVVFLGHGLRVGALFATCLLLGIALHRHRLLRWSLPLPTWFALAWVGLGLLACLSFGPWFAAPLTIGVLWAARRWRWVPVLVGLPGVAWLGTLFLTGSNWEWMTQPLRSIGAHERAETLDYRLEAMADHAAQIRQRPWFGHGGWGRGRIEGWATDSEALIHLLRNGFVGTGLRYSWLLSVLLVAQTVVWKIRERATRDVLLLLACIMGIRITCGIFGVSGLYIPLEMVGGAMTGLIMVTAAQRRTVQPSPSAAYHVHAGGERA